MSYIGVEPSDTYSSLAVQHFTTSATASYTLDQSVTSETDIRLYINNVAQQPGSSYAYTCSGTALTLSTAITSADSMYCVFVGKSIGTISPPDSSVSSAKIIDGAIVNADINASAGIAASKLDFSSATSGSDIVISSSGEITKPLQPAFMLTQSSNLYNVTGSGTNYTILFDTERFDIGGNVASSVFTAPVTGKYLLCGVVSVYGITAAADDLQFNIVTSNETYTQQTQNANDLTDYEGHSITIVADMEAGDTAHLTIQVSGEASNVCDIACSNARTSFSGCLLS